MDRNHQSTNAKAAERSITIDELKQRFFFDLQRGHIYKLTNGVKDGRADKIQFHAGKTYDKAPRYRQIQLTFSGKKVSISAHRAIWAVGNGRWPRPGYVIDHIDGDTQNNSVTNLREITIKENVSR